MARPREFDIDDAVERAMEVFWASGYDGTSLPELLAGVGISRGSLYKAFGSKRDLFMRSLDLYESRYVAPAVAMLEDASIPGRDRISAVFEGSLGRVLDGDRRGCLLCTSAAGVSHEDAEIAERVNAQLDRMTVGFATALRDAGIAAPEKQAQSLTLNYVGLRVMARGGGDEKRLSDAVARIVGDLEFGSETSVETAAA